MEHTQGAAAREYIKQRFEQILPEIRKREKETLNVTLNDIKCSNNSNTLNVTSNVVPADKKSDFISKDKYVKMLQTLESWSVFKPKSLCFTYGVPTVYNIFEYVLNTPNVSNKGAYFRAVLKKCA